MLMQLRMLKLSVEKGRQVIKQLCPSCNIAEYCKARGVCALQSSSFFMIMYEGGCDALSEEMFILLSTMCVAYSWL